MADHLFAFGTEPMDLLDETKAALRVLLFVGRHEGINITEIIRSMRVGQKAIYTALKTLNDLNLIEEKTGGRFPYPRLFYLTVKGRNVAKRLVEIEQLLKA